MSLTPPDPFARRAIALFGLPFDLCGLEEVAGSVVRAARRKERLWLSTVNLDWLLIAREDPAFERAILASDLVTMDGVPVVRLAQLAGAGGAEKVAGSDLYNRLTGEDLSIFFFGGREGAGEKAAAALAASFCPARAAGHFNPGFGTVEEMSRAAILSPIVKAAPDVLIAALSSAKGQAWLLRNGTELDVPVRAHLGAVVDFAAGTIDRAPGLLQRSGLEWAWRIYQEPSLWRRYAKDAGLLPRLVNEALATRRLTARLAAAASGPAKVGRTEDGEAVSLTLSGAIPLAALKDALRDALAAERPLKIRVASGSAPSLEVMGTLLLAREAFSARGFRYEACFEDEHARRLAGLTLKEPCVASSIDRAALA